MPNSMNSLQRSAGRQGCFDFRILHGFPGPTEEKAWREFLLRSDWPSHYTSPEFFLEPYWEGKDPFAVLAYEGDRVVGVLTGLHEGNQVVSGLPARPQVCLDKSADHSRAGQALALGVLEWAGSAGLVTIYAWSSFDALRNLGFRLSAPDGDVVLDLRKGPEALFQQLHAGQRKNVRIAIRKGVEVFEASTEEDLRAYYEVYCAWRRSPRKKIEGEQVPFSVFAAAHGLRNNRRYFLARHEGKIIAASSVRFCPGGLLEYAGNVSLEEHFLLKPNDLLKWKIVEWGCAQGFSLFSLGGAHQFHLRSGGTVVPIYRHRFDRTWFRRYDLQEAVTNTARSTLRSVPLVDKTVRQLLGKTYE